MNGQDHGENAAPLGHALQQARKARGLSEVEIGEAINLRATVVRAIERDDFTLCGGDVYARGHVRAYAKQVGLDAGPLLEAYAQRKGIAAAPTGRTTGPLTGPVPTSKPNGKPVTAPSHPPAGRPTGAPTSGPSSAPTAAPTSASASRPDDEPAGATSSRPSGKGPLAPLPTLRRAPGWSNDVSLERSGPNRALVVGAALAVLLVFLLVQVIGDLRSPSRGTTQVASPSQTASAQPTQPSSSPSSSEGPTSGSTSSPTSDKPSSPSGVAVAMNVTGDSWVSVRDASGHEVFSGLLVKGDKRRFKDGKGLRLTLGNAGGVRLTVNGKSIGSAGADGQVVRLRFGPNDPA